ncbi:unnamed protein product [Vitrella brassicaformis CCMP3155]|uniref:Uncharacterized protein n=1 Tax=Vitrella brassicaformis (strain CCMP3155) TaxID=1169540 RepID=A0A0G4GWB2_VITBC|nr:unnamed protein product [Vitrella brassicaformis CCMP3155]|eukprot:CEM35175.1 unnamed protein product [Vitrella brassicaformis CCMP3155]
MFKPSSRPSRPPRPSDLVFNPLLTHYTASRTIREKVDRALRRVKYDRRDEHELVGFLYAKEQITDEIDELDQRRDKSAISRGEYDKRVNDAHRRQSEVQKEIERRTATRRSPPPSRTRAPRSRSRSRSRCRSRSPRHPPPPHRHVTFDGSVADRRSRRHGGVQLKPAAVVRAEAAVGVPTIEAAEPSQLSETQQPPTHPQTTTPQPPSVMPEHQHAPDPNTGEVGDHEEQQEDSEGQQEDEQSHKTTEGEQENEQRQQDEPTAPHPTPSLPPGIHPVDLATPEQLKPFVHSVGQLFFTGIWFCSSCTHQSVRGATIQRGGEAEFWFQRPACCVKCQKPQPISYPHPAPVLILGPWDLIIDFSQSPPVQLDEEAVEACREHIVKLAK